MTETILKKLMGDNHLENKKIFCTVTNELFHDRRMIRICNALQEQGANICLIGTKKSVFGKLKEQNFKQKRISVFFKKGVMFYLEYNVRLFFYLIFHRFDMVNSVDTDTLAASFSAAFLKRKKIVFDAHEYFTGVPELQGKKIKKAIWNILEKIILPKIKYNYTVSEGLKKLYEKKSGQKYQVIRNFPLQSRFESIKIREKKLENQIIISYVGFLNQGRGLENAIEMMKYFDERIKLRIIGGGDLEKQLKKKTQDMNLTGRVEFTGWVEPDNIPALLSDTHFGLNLLDAKAPSYRISLANKVFDYIHLGIPCLTMDFDEYRIINKKYKCFILTNDINPKNIFKLINETLNNKKKYMELYDNSLKAAKDMVWEKEKHKLIKYYNDFLS